MLKNNLLYIILLDQILILVIKCFIVYIFKSIVIINIKFLYHNFEENYMQINYIL